MKRIQVSFDSKYEELATEVFGSSVDWQSETCFRSIFEYGHMKDEEGWFAKKLEENGIEAKIEIVED
ncbi:MAG: hypothetical protein IJ640_08655 [Prevotella sp.]|nr:hypothetical protein [Prevotella sp.]